MVGHGDFGGSHSTQNATVTVKEPRTIDAILCATREILGGNSDRWVWSDSEAPKTTIGVLEFPGQLGLSKYLVDFIGVDLGAEPEAYRPHNFTGELVIHRAVLPEDMSRIEALLKAPYQRTSDAVEPAAGQS